MALPGNPNKHWENVHHSSNIPKKHLTHSGRTSIMLVSKTKTGREMRTTDQCLCYKHSCKIVRNVSSHVQSHSKGIIHQSQVKLIFRMQRWYNIGKLMKTIRYISKLKLKISHSHLNWWRKKYLLKFNTLHDLKGKEAQQRGREGKCFNITKVLDEKPAASSPLRETESLTDGCCHQFVSGLVLDIQARMVGQENEVSRTQIQREM